MVRRTHVPPWRGCGEGDVAEKRTRRGKSFWGCTRYPECDWSVWDRPVATPCPNCQHPFLLEKSTKTRGEFLKCPECKAEMEMEEVVGSGSSVAGGG